jgi:lactate dehydrogenase-like 2-hydroxyacid dehydrogenase
VTTQRPAVFVVQPIPAVALDRMREVAEVEVYPFTDRQVSIDELAAAARRSDYLFTMHETIITKEVVDANPGLRGIILGGSEHDEMIDMEAVEAAGIPLLFPTPEDARRGRSSNAKTTADLTVALLLCLAYRVVESDAYTRAGRFRQEMTMDLMGEGCTGKTAGVVGLGVVGRELVPRLRALDMGVVYTKRSRLPESEEEELGVRWSSLDDLLAQSDYVCLMVDYNPSAHLLIGEPELARMRRTAYFINTARGRLVDEPALIRALRSGAIAGAGLDVFWDEPPVVHDPLVPAELRRLDNVVLAPHNGGATWDSRGIQTLSMADALVAAVRAGAPALSG